MGKKAKKKPHHGSAQRVKKAPSNTTPAQKTEINEKIPSVVGCKHLDKGINLEKLNTQLAKSSVLQCQGCLKSGGGKKEKKGKGKPGKNKRVPKDFSSGSIWICLACGHMGCGNEEEEMDVDRHAWQHCLYTRHPYALQCNDKLLCWCFPCQSTVQDSSVVPHGEGEDGCQSLQMQALKLVQEKLLNPSHVDNDIGFRDEEDVLGLTGKVESQSSDEKDGICNGSSSHVVRGLMNLGNTCFFNSVMQNLLALDVLREHFMKPAQLPEGPITSALRKLYVETSLEGLGQGDDNGFKKGMKGIGAISPKALFGAICAKASQFRGYQQQDSHELLRCLLDNLHTEELSVRKSKGMINTNYLDENRGDDEASEGNTDEKSNHMNGVLKVATLVNRVFDGQLCSTVCCCECDYYSVVYEPFLDLSLPIPTIPTAKKVSLPRQRASSSSKTQLKDDARSSNIGYGEGRRRSDLQIQSEAEVDISSQATFPLTLQNRITETEEKAANEPALLEGRVADIPALNEDTDWNESGPQDDTGWNGSGPQEDTGWNGSGPPEDTGWLDYLRSPTGSEDMLYQGQGPFDTSENVQQVENHYVENSIPESDLSPPDGSQTESPLPMIGDSEVLLLPYKEIDFVAGNELDVTCRSPDLAQVDTDDGLHKQLDETFDGFGQLFDEDETSVIQKEESEEVESENFLYDENGGDYLLDMGISITTEMKEEEIEATVFPMSVDGCLADFTRPELLSGENAWKCEKCASKLVKGSDNLEKRTAKEECGTRINSRLTAGSVLNISDALSMDEKQVELENGEKPDSLEKATDTELEDCTSTRCSGTSAIKADESQIHGGRGTCNGDAEKVKCNSQGENETECQQTEVLSSLNDIDNGQPSNQEDHQMRRGSAGKDSVRVSVSYDIMINDCRAQGASCSQAEGYSNKNVLGICGAEYSSEIDGINSAERPASTSSVAEGDGSSANLGGCDLQPQKFRSTGKGYNRLEKRKSKKKEPEASGIKQEATKRYLISKAPLVLTIHLKRFTQDIRGRLSKLSGHVTFQERLDLRPFLDPGCRDKGSCIYRLIGVVEHLGTMRGGHYVGYVRCHQDEICEDVRKDGSSRKSTWYYVSDSLVRRASLSEVLRSEAYLLFYEKCTLR